MLLTCHISHMTIYLAKLLRIGTLVNRCALKPSYFLVTTEQSASRRQTSAKERREQHGRAEAWVYGHSSPSSGCKGLAAVSTVNLGRSWRLHCFPPISPEGICCNDGVAARDCTYCNSKQCQGSNPACSPRRALGSRGINTRI